MYVLLQYWRVAAWLPAGNGDCDEINFLTLAPCSYFELLACARKDVTSPVLALMNYFWWAQTWHMRTPLETLGPGSMIVFELRDLQVCRDVSRFDLSFDAFHMMSTFNSGDGAKDASCTRRHRLRLQAVCFPPLFFISR